MKAKIGMGRLRIIGGQWRSRQLPVADLPGLRPTTDRVRETLFNWLQNDIPGARCVDLFAGSGALGFEAASRGCATVVMLEVQAQAAKLLADNIQTLAADNIELLRQDALQWIQQQPAEIYDIVFIDPPFDSDLLQQACMLLEQQGCLSEHACIYLEADSQRGLPELPPNWHLVKSKKAGQVGYYLIRRNYESES